MFSRCFPGNTCDVSRERVEEPTHEFSPSDVINDDIEAKNRAAAATAALVLLRLCDHDLTGPGCGSYRVLWGSVDLGPLH